jgi:hypothetical protein
MKAQAIHEIRVIGGRSGTEVPMIVDLAAQ